ncbi:MAG TPA: alpha/beta hydrolase [Syntrophales bacterium]|nr:alpha/beta hydrolase [Syntrophales bacterium]
MKKTIYEIKDSCTIALKNGNARTAAQLFYSYWKEGVAWDNLSKPMQDYLTNSMEKITIGWDAIFKDPIDLDDYRNIRVPTLIISGDRSPSVTRWICLQLIQAIEGADFFPVNGAGHMSPITHADKVNKIILQHIKNNLLRTEARKL